MALDPRLFTPAALMNRTTAPARAGFVRPGVDRQGVVSVYQDGRGMNIPRERVSRPGGPQGLEALSQQQFITEALGGDLLGQAPMSSPQSFAESMSLPDTLFETTPEDEQAAAQIASGELGLDFTGLTDKNIQSMATDDESQVDPEAKATYAGNPNIAKIMGAMAKLADTTTATNELYDSLLTQKPTPEKAREQVNKFFGIDKSKETPVWADVALSIGLSLLRGEGKKTESDSPLGGFLKDIGVAGERGLAVGKARGKEIRARKNMLDKLAFGVFREDEKNRKNLLTQLSKFKVESAEKARAYGLDLAKLIQAERKMDDAESGRIATAITSTINTIPSNVRGKAVSTITAGMGSIGRDGAANVPVEIYAMLKDNGVDLSTVEDAKNIVPTEFSIDNAVDFERYKEQFPTAFEGKTFEEGKQYKIKGFADKSQEGALTGILSVFTPVGTPIKLTTLQNQRTELKKALLTAQGEDKTRLSNQLAEVEAAIKKEIDIPSGETMLFNEDGQLVAITSDAEGFSKAQADRIAADLDRSASNFVRAAAIGDKILTGLASQPPGAEAGPLGVLANFANTVNGFRGQLRAIMNVGPDGHNDVADRYLGRDDFSHLYASAEKASNGQTAGSIFKRFDELTKDRQQLRSAIYDYAFALAGTRETGKLTDKDVANAMITLGGGDVAEGKWFASADALNAGVREALDLAANSLAPRWNNAMQKSIDAALKKEGAVESEVLAQYKFNPVRLAKRLALDDTLFNRITFENGRVGYQALDAYRGGGAGAVTPEFTPDQINAFAIINDLGQRYENQPVELQKELEKFIDRYGDPEILELYTRYQMGNSD